MKVKDLMVKNVFKVDKDETVSVALNRMKKHSINQLPVMDGSKYLGMLTLKSVVTRNIDPKKTKCAGLVTSTPSIRSSSEIKDAIELLLNSGIRAVPVIDRELVGVLSETDILSAINQLLSVSNLELSQIATECDFVAKGDDVGKVKKLMLYKNVSRVPVVENGNIIGVVGMIDLIKMIEGKKEMPSRGGKTIEAGAKEKLSIEDTPVENFMHAPVVLAGNASLSDAMGSLIKNEEAIISDNGIKIVTPKDVLELVLSSPKKQVYVQIIGLRDEGPQLTARVDTAVNEFVQKMGKIVERIQYVFLHVEKLHKGGNRHFYSIRARFGTPMGMFVAKAEGWDPITAAQDVLDNLEKEVLHKTGRMRDSRKKSRILKKRR